MKRAFLALFIGVGLLSVLGGCANVEPETTPEAKPESAGVPSGSATESKEEKAESIPAVSEADKTKAQELAIAAEKVMMDPKLPAKEKYPKALEMFAEALKVDPQNKLALDSKSMIEGIYESMGKPVPGTN